MKFSKKVLTLEKGLTKEWIITNGIGGFASSSIIGANTRRYHGLLIGALTPPGRRHLILSKVDESIEIEDEKIGLFTNLGKQYISEGYKNLESFEKEYIPIFTYKVKDVVIKKFICMEYGKNTVCILYKIKNGSSKIKLNLAPIINFRDFHSMTTDYEYSLKQEIKENKVKVILNNNSIYPIYMKLSEGKYIEHFNDTFRNMYYIEEEKRGFYPEENLSVPGRFEVEIFPKEEKEITFTCSLEENIDELDAKQVIDKEIRRLNEIIYDTEIIESKRKKAQNTKEEDILRNYVIATDNFIVYRPVFKLHTIIAGYPWFLDWGRDTLISFEGLLLVTKRYTLAKEVLLTMVKDIKYGLVPNGYSGYDNRPLYNSADSSLLLFEQIYKYIMYTNDYKFIKDKLYKKLDQIIKSYIKGIDLDNNNIYMDEDYLINSGTEETQNTWMDAKYLDYVVTPRNGKAVEINALWYNALKIMEHLTNVFDKKEESKKYKILAGNVKKFFNEKFYNEKTKCLEDVLGDKKIRPNQLFALGLSHPVVDPESDIAHKTFETITKKLVNSHGIKTLAKGEKGYIEIYEGDAFKRDSSYHQGITWPWLLGMYVDSYRNIIKQEKDKAKKKKLQEEYDKYIKRLEKTFNEDLYKEGMIGSIAEIYDSRAPFASKGALAQGWSVAEVFRIIMLGKRK